MPDPMQARLSSALTLVLIGLALLSGVCVQGCSSPQGPPSPEQRSTAADPGSPAARAEAVDPALAELQGLLAEVRAALGAGDQEAARARVAAAITRALAVLGPSLDWPSLDLLDELGGIAQTTGELAAAEAARQRTFDICRAQLPADHPALQAARERLATTLYWRGDLSGARRHFEALVQERSRTLHPDHLDLQRARHALATTLSVLGEEAESRRLFEQVLEVYERTLSEDDIDLQSVRGSVAARLRGEGQLAAARALEEQVLLAMTRICADEDPALQGARQNLAVTLSISGDLPGARALQERVLAVAARALPDQHPQVQWARGDLANTLFALGDLPGARVLQEEVLAVFSRTLPEESRDLQAARGNLARTLKYLGDARGALALEELVHEVAARTRPPGDPLLETARGNLASTLLALGESERAGELLLGNLAWCQANLADDDPRLQHARGSCARILARRGDLAGARELQEQALEAFGRTVAEDHPLRLMALQDVAVTLVRQAWTELEAAPSGAREELRSEAARRCDELVLELCRLQVRAAGEMRNSGSVRERRSRCESLAAGLGEVLSFGAGYGLFGPRPELDEAAFVLAEATRAASLGAADHAGGGAGSARAAELRAELDRAAQELARLVRRGTDSEAYRQAVARRDALQRELAELAGAGTAGTAPRVAFEPAALAARLPPDAAAVGFRRYRRSWLEAAHGSAPGSAPSVRAAEHLCAFVLRPAAAGASPGFRLGRVDLGPIEPIERAVTAWREALGLAQGRGLGVSAAGSASPSARGADLRRLVLDPVLARAGEVRHLVLVLDDVLHLVALDALPLSDGEPGVGSPESLVGDRYRIELRPSLLERGTPPPVPAGPGLLLALGGADFDSAPLDVPGGADAAGEARTPAGAEAAHGPRPQGGAWPAAFQPLPGAQREAHAIEELHAQRFGPDQERRLLTGRHASREALRNLAPRASWLHVATHGWFASDSMRGWADPEPLDARSGLALRPDGGQQLEGSSPMLLCGLAFAGANLPADALGRAPGLLTAEELATLELSSCRLAVLSACDTNAGVRRAGQGVASLQFALHQAGARSVLTSLWRVPDDATRELMSEFYRRLWIERQPAWQALWEAKRLLRDARDAAGRSKYALRDWAAWVLTGEPD